MTSSSIGPIGKSGEGTPLVKAVPVNQFEDKELTRRTIVELADFLLTKSPPQSQEEVSQLEALKFLALTYDGCLYAENLIRMNPLISVFPDEWHRSKGTLLPTRVVKLEKNNEEVLKLVKPRTVTLLIPDQEKSIEILIIARTAWQAIKRHTDNLRIKKEESERKKVEDEGCILL